MKKIYCELENQAMFKLQELSEKISDQISNRNYENVLKLDNERIKIIKSFKDKPTIKTREVLKSIVEQGKLEIKYIEDESDKLNKLHNKAIKTFRAYSI